MESDKRDTEAILSSLNCLKKVISPIELSVQRAVKNLEEFSVGVHKKSVSRKFHKIQSSKQNCKIVNNEEEKEENSCLTYLKFTNSLSVLVVNLLQVFPVKNTKCLKKQCTRQEKITPDYGKQFKSKTGALEGEKVDTKKTNLSLELLLETLLYNFTQKFIQNPHLGIFKSALKGRRTEVDSLHATLSFARFGRVPSILGAVIPSENLAVEQDSTCNRDEPENNSMPKTTYEFLTIPLTNVERLRSTLSTVSLTELVELLPLLGRSPSDHPDKKKLFSVQDFYKYTEAEGRRFFDELDRDGDGQVTLEDLELAMKKRRLPQIYAREFLHRTRSHLFAKSFGWKQFLSLMEQKEPTILRAYNTLCLSKSGTLQKSQILASLTNAGLPANEDNAAAMMRFLNADIKGSISYSHFRDFMLLLPPDRLEDDPRNIWFEAATVVAVAPPVAIPTENVLKSALAGGLSCALSAFMMHPVDTVKTRVQASTLSFPELLSKLPQIGFHGLYRGSIPAVLGQFSSHGLRTGIFEASKLVLLNVTPNLPEIQVQSLASFCSTVLGTAARIPCEVLKQRLQAGIFDNVGEAFVGTLHRDGVKGFFRGTGATLCREVPFYVAGLGLYAESKKVVQRLLNRDLEPWEVIVVGGLSGGLAAITTTPFDVIKTRMMTTQGLPVSMTGVAFSILRQDGPLGLFKGAVPRFFWIAPLGAMNFAGYELAKKALCKNEYPVNESLVSSKEAH